MTASAMAESRSALVASPGLAVWIDPSKSDQHVHDRGSVVQIDNGRLGTLGGDRNRLLLATDKGGYLVTVCHELG